MQKIEQDKKRYAMLESRKRQREEALRDFEQFIAEKVNHLFIYRFIYLIFDYVMYPREVYYILKLFYLF